MRKFLLRTHSRLSFRVPKPFSLYSSLPPIPVPCNHLLQAKSSPSFPYATCPLLCRGEELSQAVSGIPGTASLQEGGEKITALESRVENLLRTGVLAL